MALNKILCLAFMFCFVHKAASQIKTDAELILTPQYLLIDPHLALDGGTVTVECKAVSVGSNEMIRSIFIKRAKADGSFEELAHIYRGDDVPEVLLPGMSATASIGDTGQRYITLTMEKTACEDAGNYTCRLRVTESGEPEKQPEKTTSLNVEVKPGNITLKATPSYQNYDVNKTLTMLCNGPVGTVIDNTPVVTWIWQSRNLTVYPIINNNVDEVGWVNVQNDTDNIVYKDEGEPIPEPNACYETRKSKLTMTLFKKDSKRMFRCFIRRGSTDYKQFADFYTIMSVKDPQETTTPGSDDGDSGASKSSIGPIIGGVVGALVAVIVIIVIVVFVVRRRSANKEDTYAADDPGNKPTDESNGPPYPMPAVAYSQPPNRFARNDREPYGVANKGMDRDSPRDHHQPRSKEPSSPSNKDPSPYPDDKNDTSFNNPPRYANDFHQGRRNRGYSTDPDPTAAGVEGGRRSRYSSDEDGTADSQVNTSQSSLRYGNPTIGTPI